jgi:hypothetical protein
MLVVHRIGSERGLGIVGFVWFVMVGWLPQAGLDHLGGHEGLHQQAADEAGSGQARAPGMLSQRRLTMQRSTRPALDSA